MFMRIFCVLWHA